MPAFRLGRDVLFADCRTPIAQSHLDVCVVFGNEQIARTHRHKCCIPQIVILAVWPKPGCGIAKQLGDTVPHILRSVKREVRQPFVEHRAARRSLLQALKSGQASRLPLKVAQAEDVRHGCDVVRPSLTIDGEQFGTSQERHGRTARCRPVG